MTVCVTLVKSPSSSSSGSGSGSSSSSGNSSSRVVVVVLGMTSSIMQMAYIERALYFGIIY